MFIDHKRKFVFFHAEKTAGTFIENKFCEMFGVEHWLTDWASRDWGNGHRGKSLEGQFTKHLPPQGLRNRWGVEKFDDYFKFGCVRNPWSMWLSYFSMTRQWHKFASPTGHHFKKHGRVHCLNDFVNINEFVQVTHNNKTPTASRNQFDKLSNYSTKFFTLQKGVNAPVLVDKVVKVERLQDDMNEVCDILNIERIDTNDRPKTTRNNGETTNCESRHGHTRDEFDRESADIIERVSGLDVHNFKFHGHHPFR